MNPLANLDDLIDANKIDLALAVAAGAVRDVKTADQASAVLHRLARLGSQVKTAISRSSLDNLVEALDAAFPDLGIVNQWQRIADEQRRAADQKAERRVAEEQARRLLQSRLIRLAKLSGNGDGSLQPDKGLEVAFRAYGAVLLAAYQSGIGAFESVTTTHLREYRPQMVATLKALAVELLTGGASLEGLKADSVPLVAYALTEGRLPLGTADDAPQAEERANDALLAHAEVISRTSGAERQLVLSLFRQGFLIGLADRYQKAFDLVY